VRVLDHAEYIVPCLASADAVVHSFSTSAIEAWILGKPTISLLPAEDRERLTLNHMQDEVVASSLDETMEYLLSYPRTDLMKSVGLILGQFGDGKSTIRLAREIHKLQPKAEKALRRPTLRHRSRRELKWWLEDCGFRHGSLAPPGANTKMRRLAEWEGLRHVVRARYHAKFRDYIQRHKVELLG
jgi:hypothetical protein